MTDESTKLTKEMTDAFWRVKESSYLPQVVEYMVDVPITSLGYNHFIMSSMTHALYIEWEKNLSPLELVLL